jgi:hypothetical protein
MNKSLGCRWAWAVMAAGLSPAWAAAAAFSADSVVVYRVGNGAATLNSNATGVFLDEYAPSGVLLQSIALPVVPTGVLGAVTASGNSDPEGRLSLSADGRALVLPGYSALPGGATASASPSTTPRVIAVVDAAGGFATFPVTALSSRAYAAVSANGQGAYLSGSNGIAYVDATGQSVKLLNGQTFDMAIADGQLYYTNGANPGIYALGQGLPTGGSPAGRLEVAVVGTNPRGFTFADLSSAVPGVDTLYVADFVDSRSGVSKYSKQANGEWLYRQTADSGALDLTNRVVAGQVQLFGTGVNGLYTLTDGSGYDGVLTGSFTTLAAAAARTAFRGVALAPAVPEPGAWAMALAGVGCSLWRIRRRPNRR